jgi:hypothetical protein
MTSFKSSQKLALSLRCCFLLKFVLVTSISAGTKNPTMQVIQRPKVGSISHMGGSLAFVSAIRWTDQCPKALLRGSNSLLRCPPADRRPISHGQGPRKFSCFEPYKLIRRSLTICASSVDSQGKIRKVAEHPIQTSLQSKTQFMIGGVPRDLSDGALRAAVEQSADDSEVTVHIDVAEDLRDTRLDTFLSSRITALSRSALARLIRADCVYLNGRVPKPASKLRAGDHVVVNLPPPPNSDVQAENIPLHILMEDDQIIVVNKQVSPHLHLTAIFLNDEMLYILFHSPSRSVVLFQSRCLPSLPLSPHSPPPTHALIF